MKPIHLTSLLSLLPALVHAETPDDFQRRQECFKEAQQIHEIKLNNGVQTEELQVATPLKIKVPAGSNPDVFAECLEREGLIPQGNREAYVKLVHECRNKARSQKVVIGQGETTLSASQDDEAFQACMRQGGEQLDVEIIAPEAGE